MEIIPTGGALGAEIRGVDVAKPLAPAEVAPAEVAALEEAILQHLLLVFRKRTQMFGDAPFLEL